MKNVTNQRVHEELLLCHKTTTNGEVNSFPDRRYQEFVNAWSVTKMNDPAFKEQFGTKSVISVDKLDMMLTVYPAVKYGTRLLSELNKKDWTWIFLSAFNYNKLIKL